MIRLCGWVACPKCNGSGELIGTSQNFTCPSCDGGGVLFREETRDVRSAVEPQPSTHISPWGGYE